VAQLGDIDTRVKDYINRVFGGGGIDQNALNRFANARQDVAFLGLLQEVEIGQKSPEAHALTVCELYKQLLNRDVDAGGAAAWTRFLAQVGDRQQLAAIIVGSDEFFFRPDLGNGDVTKWLTEIYRRYLGRTVNPSPAELTFWINAFHSGVPRQTIAQMIVTSQEGNFVQIQRIFNNLLLRNADLGGLLFFEQRMRRVSLHQIERDIIFATGPNGEPGEFQQLARTFAAGQGVLHDAESVFPAPSPTPPFEELGDPLLTPGLPFTRLC
jgi:hypothetical protein